MWNNHQVNYKYGESERNRTKAKNAINKRNFVLGILMISLFPLIVIIGFILK
jgi:hypothetical protein